MSKKKETHIRFTDEDFNFLTEMAKMYNCTKTDLITELIRRGEYTELNYDEVGNYILELGKIGNNINQIARALNTINKQELMSKEDYEFIKLNFETVKAEYEKHRLGSQEMLKNLYSYKRRKVKYKLNEED